MGWPRRYEVSGKWVTAAARRGNMGRDRAPHACGRGRFRTILLIVGLSGAVAAPAAWGQRADTRSGKSAVVEKMERAAHADDQSLSLPSAEDSPLIPGCTDCERLHISGEVYEADDGGVASPVGSSYSVTHQVAGDPDGGGPLGVRCVLINHPATPGAPDDIVTFNNIAETIRTDIFMTVPTVRESDTSQPNGRRLIEINTSSPMGTDLFPGGLFLGNPPQPLTDACFSVGLDDPLTWGEADFVEAATIEFLKDGMVLEGPHDASSFFTNPWNGVTSIILPDGAGNGYNGVRLRLFVDKMVTLANDECRGQIEVFNGDTVFSNIGATTDGPDEFEDCNFLSYSDIGSDVWFNYEATCTGNMTVDLCDSSYDTKFAVYAGCLQCPVAPGPLVCNDDLCGVQSFASLPVNQGECFTIRIGGYLGFQGNGVLNVSCNIIPPPTGACCSDIGTCMGTLTEEACTGQQGTWFQGQSCPGFQCPVSPPLHDECENCVRVETGVPFFNRTNTQTTGTDLTPPSCGVDDNLDVWHCWTADCTGRVTISTCGTSQETTFDTTLAVFDECGGALLDCDDDGCQTTPLRRSQLEIDVSEGTTYYIRVAGYEGAIGAYKLTVNPCRNACCLESGFCGYATESQCLGVGGTYLGEGVQCRGDAGGNGVDDACEVCPAATIVGAVPEDGTVDARQPHARNVPLPRQGIGAPGNPGGRETILIVLDPPLSDAADCFDLCETGVDSSTGPNSITEAVYRGSGIYELALAHAIPAGQVTTIQYLGDGSFVEYFAHPSNVNGDAIANAADVQSHLDCCLLGTCVPAWDFHSCDIDHSNLLTPADIVFVVDLLNGTQLWNVWNGTALPSNTTCP